MKYHDNVVVFEIENSIIDPSGSVYSPSGYLSNNPANNYQIVSGSFTIEDFSITDGQDPDKNIKVGLVAKFGKDGKMSFRVGQSDTQKPADWFNARIKPDQNTFNKAPKKLNFAFIGKLEITITGGILAKNQSTVILNNIVIAQGNDAGRQNWWIGGKESRYIKNHRIESKGINAQKANLLYQFYRGGNGVNKIGVTPVVLFQTEDWMGRLNDSLKIEELVMPGSHDAGMSELHHCTIPVLSDEATQTQAVPVGKQLEYGSRYFDIRVDFDHSVLVTYHRTDDGTGCNGQNLDAVLNETVGFLKKHPGETVILKFSHIRNNKGHDPADIKKRVNELLNAPAYSAYMYVNPTKNINLTKVNLGAVRGKMILVFDYSDYIDPATGRFRYLDGASADNLANLVVYDKYSETSSYEKMKQNQLEKWEKYANKDKGYLFLLSWTLTCDALHLSVHKLADEANGKLPAVLQEQIVGKKAIKPNIVYIDYVNGQTTQAIIQYNF